MSICIYVSLCIYLCKNLRSNLQVLPFPSSPNLHCWTLQLVEFASGSSTPYPNLHCWILQRDELASGSSTPLTVPPPESSTALESHSSGSSTPLGVPLLWEFHPSGSSTPLGVPLLWEFHSSGSSTLLGVPPPGSSSLWEFHPLKFPHSER